METLLKTIPFYQSINGSITPAVDSLVVADVVDFTDIIVTCTLPEYAGLEAIIPTSEIKVKRGKAVRNYIKKGQQIVAQVIRIDSQGRVDMSLKVVQPEEEEKTLDKYHKALKVLQIVATAANYNKDKTIELYSLTHDFAKDYISPYAYLEACLVGDATSPTLEILHAIQKRIPMPSYTVSKEIQLRYNDPNGVDALRKKLDEIVSTGLQVHIVSPPLYKVSATSNSVQKAQALLDSFSL